MRCKSMKLPLLFVGLAFVARADVATEAPTIDQLRAKPELLHGLYQPAHSLTVEEHYFRGYLAPGEAQPEIVPEKYGVEDLYVVRNGDQVLYIKKHAFRRPELDFITLDEGVPVLCLPDPDGGNGWRVNPWFVVLQDPLKLLGQVSEVRDIDGDGSQDLAVVDDIWEDYWRVSHAGAPAAILLYRVDKGALVVDRPKTDAWAMREIARLNAKIQELRPAAAVAMGRGETADVELFSAILSKFLYYRAANLLESGWEELKKDLRTFDAQVFPIDHEVPGKGPIPTTPVEEIEQKVAKSLEARGSLEQDLQRYTSAPLNRE